MRRPHLRKSSVATIAAATAIVVATGGTGAYAAHLITSKQIKNNTIKSIDVRNGTLTTADLAPGTIPAPYGGTSAYSTYHDAGVSISTLAAGLDPVVLNLNIPSAGSYTILATTALFNSGGAGVLARCTLNAGGDSDQKHVSLGANGGVADGETTALQIVHTFAAAGTATLRCYSFSVAVGAQDTKITATKVDHLTNTPG